MKPDAEELEDPLTWWENNSMMFPTLWTLSQLYLAIPATSASSERAFDVAGNIVTSLRVRLSTHKVESLHFLHENGDLLKEKELEDKTDEVICLD